MASTHGGEGGETELSRCNGRGLPWAFVASCTGFSQPFVSPALSRYNALCLAHVAVLGRGGEDIVWEKEEKAGEMGFRGLRFLFF